MISNVFIRKKSYLNHHSCLNCGYNVKTAVYDAVMYNLKEPCLLCVSSLRRYHDFKMECHKDCLTD